MSDEKPKNHPWAEVVAQASAQIAAGAEVFQKFTCSHCGARQTMETPNVFFMMGACEECGEVTDIKKEGCNYMLIKTLKPGGTR